MKLEELGIGAKFIYKDERTKYVYIKINILTQGNTPINAIRLDDGEPTLIGLNKKVEPIIM